MTVNESVPDATLVEVEAVRIPQSLLPSPKQPQATAPSSVIDSEVCAPKVYLSMDPPACLIRI